MSNKTINYTQCKLCRDGNIYSTAWIPSTLAIKGKGLEIKSGDDWQTGWKVVETYTTVNKEYLEEQRKAYKHFNEVLETHC
jgi:hypothetical protein